MTAERLFFVALGVFGALLAVWLAAPDAAPGAWRTAPWW